TSGYEMKWHEYYSQEGNFLPSYGYNTNKLTHKVKSINIDWIHHAWGKDYGNGTGTTTHCNNSQSGNGPRQIEKVSSATIYEVNLCPYGYRSYGSDAPNGTGPCRSKYQEDSVKVV